MTRRLRPARRRPIKAAGSPVSSGARALATLPTAPRSVPPYEVLARYWAEQGIVAFVLGGSDA